MLADVAARIADPLRKAPAGASGGSCAIKVPASKVDTSSHERNDEETSRSLSPEVSSRRADNKKRRTFKWLTTAKSTRSIAWDLPTMVSVYCCLAGRPRFRMTLAIRSNRAGLRSGGREPSQQRAREAKDEDCEGANMKTNLEDMILTLGDQIHFIKVVSYDLHLSRRRPQYWRNDGDVRTIVNSTAAASRRTGRTMDPSIASWTKRASRARPRRRRDRMRRRPSWFRHRASASRRAERTSWPRMAGAYAQSRPRPKATRSRGRFAAQSASSFRCRTEPRLRPRLAPARARRQASPAEGTSPTCRAARGRATRGRRVTAPVSRETGTRFCPAVRSTFVRSSTNSMKTPGEPGTSHGRVDRSRSRLSNVGVLGRRPRLAPRPHRRLMKPSASTRERWRATSSIDGMNAVEFLLTASYDPRARSAPSSTRRNR